MLCLCNNNNRPASVWAFTPGERQAHWVLSGVCLQLSCFTCASPYTQGILFSASLFSLAETSSQTTYCWTNMVSLLWMLSRDCFRGNFEALGIWCGGQVLVSWTLGLTRKPFLFQSWWMDTYVNFWSVSCRGESNPTCLKVSHPKTSLFTSWCENDRAEVGMGYRVGGSETPTPALQPVNLRASEKSHSHSPLQASMSSSVKQTKWYAPSWLSWDQMG